MCISGALKPGVGTIGERVWALCCSEYVHCLVRLHCLGASLYTLPGTVKRPQRGRCFPAGDWAVIMQAYSSSTLKVNP